MATQVTNAILSTTGGLAAAGQAGIATARESARNRADVISKFGKTLTEIPSMLEEGRAEREVKSIADAVTAAKLNGTWDDAYAAAERVPTRTTRGSAEKYKLALLVQEKKDREEKSKLELALKQREMAKMDADEAADAESRGVIAAAFADPNVDPSQAMQGLLSSGKIGMESFSKLASMMNALQRPLTEEQRREAEAAKEAMRDSRMRDIAAGVLEGQNARAAAANEARAASDAAAMERAKLTLEARATENAKDRELKDKFQTARLEIDRDRAELARTTQEMTKAFNERRLNVSGAVEVLRNVRSRLANAEASRRKYVAETGLGEDDEVLSDLDQSINEMSVELDAAEDALRKMMIYSPAQTSAPAPTVAVDDAMKSAFDALPPAEQAKALEAMTPEERAKVGR